jgi:RHS repeat-associated protein
MSSDRQNRWLSGCVVALTAAWLIASAANARLSGAQGRTAPQGATGRTATLLPDGRWLHLGGWRADGSPEPASMTERDGRSASYPVALHDPRAGHSATLLPDGSVLVIGGTDRTGRFVASFERYDPGRQVFETVRNVPLLRRANHTATLLSDGRVLIAGGTGATGHPVVETVLLDPTTFTTAASSPSLASARVGHRASLSADGRVRLTGGTDASGRPIADDELLDWRDGVGTRVAAERGARELYVSESEPIAGAADVRRNTRLWARFSTPVRVWTVNERTVVLADAAGHAVPIHVTPVEAGMLAFVRPLADLEAGATYTLTLDGLSAPDGLLLPTTIVTFTTEGQRPPTTPEQGDGVWIPDPRARNGWRVGRKPSPWEQLPRLQAPAGVTAVSGQVLLLDGRPLPGVSIKVGNRTTTSDRSGRFLVDSIDAGRQMMIVDGRTAGSTRREYGVFKVGLDLRDGRTNELPYTNWMPRLDTRHAATITSPTAEDTVLTTPYIPGLEVRLPRGTIIRDIDNEVVREVTITPIPVDRPPFPLPVGVDVPIYFTVQPGGAYLESVASGWPTGAQIVYPNYYRLKPSTELDFWQYDPEEKGWHTYGVGRVSPDATRIVPGPGVAVYEFTGAMVGFTSFAPAQGPPPCNPSEAADPVDLATGLYVDRHTDLSISDVVPVAVTRTYRTRDSRFRPFGIGATHPYEILIIGDTNPWTYAEIVMADGSRVHYNRISAGTGFADAVYESTDTPGECYKSKISWNNVRNGWDLRFRDGTIYKFPDAELATSPAFAAIVGVTDRFGNNLTFTRSTFDGSLTRITSSNGRYIDFTYDGNGRITQARDNALRTVGYAYDTVGRLWKVTDPDLGVTEYAYDGADRLRTIKDPTGAIALTNEYDLSGRVISQKQADGSVYQFAYTIGAGGAITQTDVTDPRGFVRRVTFDAKGYWLTDTRAVGKPEQQTLTVERNASTHAITSYTDGLGRRTTYAYDTSGNLTGVTRLPATLNVTTTMTYDPVYNQLATTTDPLLHTTTYGYDAQGKLESITDHLNHATTFTTNSRGQVTTITDASGIQTLQYTLGHPTGFVNGANETLTRTFGVAGQVLTSVDPLGNTTTYQYDGALRPRYVTDPLQQVTSLTYDAIGNLQSVTDARTGLTAFTYDGMGRVKTRTDPLLRVESFVYDASGNLVQWTDRRGLTTTYRYDGLNRRIESTYADGSSSAFTYDAANRLRSVVDSHSGTTTLDYDDLDRLTSETTPRGVVTYTYDAADRRETMTVAGQPTITYGYDAANRLTTITQSGATFTFTYDNANRPTALLYPNGTSVEYGYDAASRVASLTYKQGSTVLGNLTYAYDAAGRRIEMGGTFARTSLPAPVTSTSYDAANQLTQWNGATLTYDANGNLLSDGAREYSWDARNRLQAVGGVVPASFVYDAVGRRIEASVNGSTRAFLYDGINAVQEQVGGVPSANALFALAVDELLARTDAAGTRTVFGDALGSTIALVNGSGALATRYTYDPFGAASQSGEASANPALFTGREADDSGLFYYRARYYDPRAQRFISEDPLGLLAGPNLYAYVENNPVSFTDPMGLERVADENVKKCMCDLWKAASYGWDRTERSAWIVQADGTRGCVVWPHTATPGKETWRGPIPRGSEAIVHTHPTRATTGRSGPRPSSGQGEDHDTATAQKMPVYVVSDDGIWKARPNCKTPTKVAERDWQKECKK